MPDKKPTGAAATKPATAAAAKPGDKPAATTNAPAAAATTADEPRKRNFLSPQKALAIQLAGLVALLSIDKIAALLTEDQKAQVKTANDMADELNSQTIKPVQERIGTIQKELAALTADAAKLAEPATVQKVKDYANELSRLQKRLETFTGAATATV